MEQQTGCLISPKDLRDYKINKACMSIELPESFTLEPTPIKNQGNVGSCVAHALSSMLEKYNEIFSTGWIYGYRPFYYHQGTGMYPREALKTLQKLGAVKEQDFSFNIEMDEAKEKVNSRLTYLKRLAQEFKIKSYVRLKNNNEIKQFLYNSKCPIPFSIYVDGLKVNNEIIETPKSYENLSSHMMLIIGWNKDGFIIQNSWGINWGNNGIAILPYEYEIKEAWGVNLYNSQEEYIEKPKFYFIRKIIEKIKSVLVSGRLN